MDAAHWPLVGRDAACATIASALRQYPSRSLVIAGPAGVGRTRLAREAIAIAERDGSSVRWAAATGPGALVPLGAMAHLIPAGPVVSDPLVLLQRATSAIVGDGSGPPRVLAVDDVHLLDQLSITLLHQLAAGGAVTLVMTVRTDGATSDPVAPLWKDGWATRIDVPPLRRADLERLVVHALGGDVECRTAERLWGLTQGNPLFLREVLEEGRTSGRLRPAHGLWRWEGTMTPSQRLEEIVLSQIGDLDPAEWRALEVVATAESLGAQHLVELSSPQAVASLERRGAISGHATSGLGELTAARPMDAAVVRRRASEAGVRAVRRELLDGAEDFDSRPEHLVRQCVALLDSDLPVRDAGLLIRAARLAMAELDVSQAERLARASAHVGGGAEALLLQVEALRWLGEPERGDALSAQGMHLAATDADRARLMMARSLTWFCAMGRTDDASEALREARATVRSSEARSVLAVAEAVLDVLGGDPGALQRAEGALQSVPRSSPARPLATAAASLSLALAGQARRALSVAATGWRMLASVAPVSEFLLVRVLLAHAEVVALDLAGQTAEMDRRTEEHLRKTLAAPEWAGDAIALLHRGWAALTRGRWREAVRWLEEAFSGLQRQDPVGVRGLCCSLLAVARSLVGDLDRATELVADRACCLRGLPPVFEPFSGLGEACLAGVQGRTREAGVLLLQAAACAAEQRQFGVQALLLHRVVQFGGAAEVVAPLRDLAGRLDSPLVPDLAAHAQAAAAEDVNRLEEASRRLQEAGLLMTAADSAAAAAAAHERRGHRRPAAEWTTRAMALAHQCGVTRTPVLEVLQFPTLTRREEEIARMASRGLSNQAIADTLVVSVRTVETHLSHVYAKLGISSRADLPTFLAGAPTASGRKRPRRIGRMHQMLA